MLAIVHGSTTAGLINAINNDAAGDVINVAATTYTLTASLQPKASMTVQGAGADSTTTPSTSNFSIELTHMNDHYVELDHNYILGTVSIPKFAGGSLPTGTDPYTFHIHHNYFRASYALEWARNGAAGRASTTT